MPARSSAGATPKSAPNSDRPLLLGELLSESYAYALAHVKEIIAGAVIFGALSLALHSFIGAGAAGMLQQQMGKMGMDATRMQELTQRMQEGDKTAEAEFEQEMERLAQQFDGMGENDVAAMFDGAFFARFASLIGWSMLAGIIVSVLASSFALVLALKPQPNAGAYVTATLSTALPLLGVWAWSFVRSFIWIPILGFIPAIILGPRFAAAPVLLVRDRKGVFESVSMSYTLTRGYWGKIVGNSLVFGLILIAVTFVAGLLFSLTGAVSIWIPMILGALVTQAMMLFGGLFYSFLGATVIAHPKT